MSWQAPPAFGPRKRARSDNQGMLTSSNSSPSDANVVDALSFPKVLARIDELEGKCAQLENRCRSLQSSLQQQQLQTPSVAEGIVSSIVSHIDSKFRSMESAVNSKLQDLEHSSRWLESLHKNRQWKYSAPTIPISYWVSQGFDEEYVESADSFLEDIETVTCAMRRGESSDSYVHLGFGERFDEIDNMHLVYDEIMLSHWMEFVDALEQYQWFLNRSSTGHNDSTFILSDVQIPSELCFLLERALPFNYFKRLTFQNNHFGRFGILMAIKCIECNPKLLEFILSENEINTEEDAKRLCQVVNDHTELEIFSLKRSCHSFAHGILTSIMHENCKLKCIDLPGNSIRTHGSRHIANFLAANPILSELTLENNHFNDDDAEAIAEALKTNTNLKCLILRENDITNRGVDALRKVIADSTSLNASAASNHSCQIYLTNNPDCANINESADSKVNRGEKLYSILCSQNAALSNAHSCGSKLHLPVALESIQKYAQYSVKKRSLSHEEQCHVPALSIVYEVMRNKAPELYNPHEELASDVDIPPCVSND